MERITEVLQRRIGPLPAWAWVVVASGAVFLLRSLRGSGGDAPRNREATGSAVGSGGASVIHSASGAGAPAPTGFGAPDGTQSSLFVSSPGFSVEGPAGDVSSIIDAFLAQQRSDVSTGGGGDAPIQPDPVAQPVAPTTTTTRRYNLGWLATGQVVGSYATRLECSQAAQRMDPNSSPPGSSMFCRSS